MRSAGWIAAGLLVLAPAGARADDADEVPLVGRPASLPFSGASARFVAAGAEFRAPFALAATASPTTGRARSPITYVVTLRALGPTVRPPGRIDLRQVPAFNRSFHVEDVMDAKRAAPAATAWNWRYRLTPRSAEVDEIPGFPFAFFNPDLQPADRAFQVLYSDPIPLHQESAGPTGPDSVDDAALTLAEGTAVLERAEPWSGPGPAAWALVGLAPPLSAVLCYLLWRRLHPDAARAAARRRSRAARVALDRVRQAERRVGRDQAEQLTRALVGFLRERLDLTPAEPTPDEVSMQLARQGIPDELIREAAALLGQCAAARFAPIEAAPGLAERTRRVVLDLEEASCPA